MSLPILIVLLEDFVFGLMSIPKFGHILVWTKFSIFVLFPDFWFLWKPYTYLSKQTLRTLHLLQPLVYGRSTFSRIPKKDFIQEKLNFGTIDAVFYRWVRPLHHKYGSNIIFRSSNLVLILKPINPVFSEK